MALAALMAAGGLCLLGIGGGPADGSTAVPLPAADAAQVASATTAFLAERLPAANSVLLVTEPAGCDRGDTYSPSLVASLRQAGFGLATDGAANPGANLVRYHVTQPWKDSVLLRIQLNDRETTQLFTRGLDGVLRVAGPQSVRTVK